MVGETDATLGTAGTVATVVADVPAIAAVMLAVPVVPPVAKPCVPGAFPTATTEELEELQAADAVRSWVLPSEKVPVALNWVFDPARMKGFAGRMVIETNAATLTEAEPITLPAEAVSIVAPAAWPLTNPLLPGELPTGAADGFDEFQMTDWRVCMLPSLNVPVATNC
jgi:hypothetical protein